MDLNTAHIKVFPNISRCQMARGVVNGDSGKSMGIRAAHHRSAKVFGISKMEILVYIPFIIHSAKNIPYWAIPKDQVIIGQ